MFKNLCVGVICGQFVIICGAPYRVLRTDNFLYSSISKNVIESFSPWGLFLLVNKCDSIQKFHKNIIVPLQRLLKEVCIFLHKKI